MQIIKSRYIAKLIIRLGNFISMCVYIFQCQYTISSDNKNIWDSILPILLFPVVSFHAYCCYHQKKIQEKKEKYRSKLSIRKSYFSFTRIQYTKCPYPVSDTLFLLTLGPPFLSNFMPIFILGSSNLWLRTNVVGVLLFFIYFHNVTKNCCVNDFISL